jgi:peptide/nickel transport system substrate-binding protein
MLMNSISRRRLLEGAAVAGIVATTPGAGFAQTGSPARATRLTVGVQGTPRTLEPLREFSNVLWRVGYNVFEGLLGVDYRGTQAIKPLLARAWTRVSPTVMELTLKDGVRFHNGEVMTAEDVTFSFGQERMMGENAPGRAIAQIFVGTIERVEAVDERTVRVVTRAPDPLLEQRLADWGAQIICKKAFLAAGSFEAWERAPVGTGPYKVGTFRTDDRVVIEAHDAYHGGKPPVRDITFRVIPELAGRIAALQTGDADIITEVSPDQVPQIAARAGLEVVGGPIQNLRVLCYDKTNPVLADPRVRRALSLAIDRKLIVESLYNGRTRVADTYMHPSFGALYDAERKGTPYDPATAKSLLRAAGYEGQTIPYRLLPNYYTLQAPTGQVLVEMWRAVGLNVELQFRENFQQVTEAAGVRGIRDWSNSILFRDPVGALWRLYGARGPMQRLYKEWTNPEFNELGEKLETSLDPAERRRIFGRMLDIYEEIDPPGTTLHDLPMLYGKRADLGWTPYPVEYMDFGPGNLRV